MPPSAHHSRGRAPVIVTVVLTALLLAACGPQPDAGTSTPLTNSQLSLEDNQPLAFTECVADRYTVGHPADWNTNGDDGLLGPCQIFHPGDIEVHERPRDISLHYAALLYVDDIDFDERLAADNTNEVIQERETTVDGRRALVVEYRSTGQALTPEGEHSYTWAIDLDGQILVATTSSVGATDYERDKRILDRMVTEQLTIHTATS